MWAIVAKFCGAESLGGTMAKPRNSTYPIGQLLIRLWRESGLSLPDFFSSLGYSNTDKAVKRFDQWVQWGQGEEHLLTTVKRGYPQLEVELAQALAITQEMLAVEDKQAEEILTERLRATFTPYLQAIPEQNRPSSISLFAITGGNSRQRTELPADILERADGERLTIVRNAISEHMTKSGGRTLFQGKIVSYQVFWRFDEPPTSFSTDGILLGQDTDKTPGEPFVVNCAGRRLPWVIM